MLNGPTPSTIIAHLPMAQWIWSQLCNMLSLSLQQVRRVSPCEQSTPYFAAHQKNMSTISTWPSTFPCLPYLDRDRRLLSPKKLSNGTSRSCITYSRHLNLHSLLEISIFSSPSPVTDISLGGCPKGDLPRFTLCRSEAKAEPSSMVHDDLTLFLSA